MTEVEEAMLKVMVGTEKKNARITLVSATSIVEGGHHDVILKSANAKL